MPLYKFCPSCGEKLAHREVEGRKTGVCEKGCGLVMDPKSIVGSSAIILDKPRGEDVRVLLLRRAHGENKGKWELPGGHVGEKERGPSDVTEDPSILKEHPEKTAGREAREETGLTEHEVELLGLHGRRTTHRNVAGKSVPDYHHGYIFLLKNPDAVITLSREHDAHQWFRLDELPPASQLAHPHNEVPLGVIRDRIKRGKPPHLDS